MAEVALQFVTQCLCKISASTWSTLAGMLSFSSPSHLGTGHTAKAGSSVHGVQIPVSSGQKLFIALLQQSQTALGTFNLLLACRLVP